MPPCSHSWRLIRRLIARLGEDIEPSPAEPPMPAKHHLRPTRGDETYAQVADVGMADVHGHLHLISHGLIRPTELLFVMSSAFARRSCRALERRHRHGHRTATVRHARVLARPGRRQRCRPASRRPVPKYAASARRTGASSRRTPTRCRSWWSRRSIRPGGSRSRCRAPRRRCGSRRRLHQPHPAAAAADGLEHALARQVADDLHQVVLRHLVRLRHSAIVIRRPGLAAQYISTRKVWSVYSASRMQGLKCTEWAIGNCAKGYGVDR